MCKFPIFPSVIFHEQISLLENIYKYKLVPDGVNRTMRMMMMMMMSKKKKEEEEKKEKRK